MDWSLWPKHRSSNKDIFSCRTTSPPPSGRWSPFRHYRKACLHTIQDLGSREDSPAPQCLNFTQTDLRVAILEHVQKNLLIYISAKIPQMVELFSCPVEPVQLNISNVFVPFNVTRLLTKSCLAYGSGTPYVLHTPTPSK